MIELLSTRFRSDGFDFQLVRREGPVALLAKQKPNYSQPSFEVVIIQTRPAEHIFGRDLPEREVMPPSESWGTLGWSYADLAGAESRFNRLCPARRKGLFPPKGFTPGASKRFAASINATNAPPTHVTL
jgi:hypothetical protein